MAVSPLYYLRFWLNNTALSVGCILLSMFFPPTMWLSSYLMTVHPWIYPVCLFVFLQLFIVWHFIGALRCYFEFAALVWGNEKRSNAAIRKAHWIGTLIVLKLDEISTIGLVRDDIYREMLESMDVMSDPELALSLRIRIARSLSKQSDPSDAINHLKEALSISPQDIVANYLMGTCQEKIGNVPEAMAHYEVCRNESLNVSKNLEPVFLKNIKRLERRGPTKKMSMPGIKFVIY